MLDEKSATIFNEVLEMDGYIDNGGSFSSKPLTQWNAELTTIVGNAGIPQSFNGELRIVAEKPNWQSMWETQTFHNRLRRINNGCGNAELTIVVENAGIPQSFNGKLRIMADKPNWQSLWKTQAFHNRLRRINNGCGNAELTVVVGNAGIPQ